MKKIVMSSFVAVVAVFALLGPASASSISNAVDEAIAAVNMQIDTISIDVAHCGSCGSEKASCGCKDKCGCSKPKCGCKDKCGSKCGSKCGCSKPKCGCKDKCGSKCGDKCGCSKPKCGCKDKCCKSECCPKQVENYPDANRGAEGEWARDGLSRQRA